LHKGSLKVFLEKKTKELKGIHKPGTYDEIMRMMKWFNVKNREHE
jgi:hypothetical protein